jgi:hypothetical protein
MHRRQFLYALLARPSQMPSIRIFVIETFTVGNSSAALLVHHSEPATRDVFAKWLQAHPRAMIRIRLQDAQEVAATIFRVRMCFGRGLILLQSGLPVRERDILTMTLDRDLP